MLHVRLELVLQAVLAARPAAMLELGCGVGVLRAELRRRAPGVAYFGCDVSRSAVAQIGDPRVVRVDLNEDPVPFADVSFDCVTGSGILEYVADVPRLLRDVHGRLRTGGALVVSYFNMRHVHRRLQALLGRAPYRHPQWANDYSLAGLRSVVAAAGFRIEDEIPTNLGLGGSPAIGRERWRPGALRAVRRVPGVQAFAHQLVLVCAAR
jgi:SAM-dependent methyltransferase